MSTYHAVYILQVLALLCPGGPIHPPRVSKILSIFGWRQYADPVVGSMRATLLEWEIGSRLDKSHRWVTHSSGR